MKGIEDYVCDIVDRLKTQDTSIPIGYHFAALTT